MRTVGMTTLAQEMNFLMIYLKKKNVFLGIPGKGLKISFKPILNEDNSI